MEVELGAKLFTIDRLLLYYFVRNNFPNRKHVTSISKLRFSKAILQLHHRDVGTPLQWEDDDILCRSLCSVQ